MCSNGHFVAHIHVMVHEAFSFVTEDGGGRDADVGQGHLGVVARHVEGPPHELDLKPGEVGGNDEAADPLRVAGAPLVRAKTMSWVASWRPELKRLTPLITQSSPSRTARVSSHVASLSWSGSVSPKPRQCVPVMRPGRTPLSVPGFRIPTSYGPAEGCRRSTTRSGVHCGGAERLGGPPRAHGRGRSAPTAHLPYGEREHIRDVSLTRTPKTVAPWGSALADGGERSCPCRISTIQGSRIATFETSFKGPRPGGGRQTREPT